MDRWGFKYANAELFLGIHLRDNPGLDAPPCGGLVLISINGVGGPRIEICSADTYSWSHSQTVYINQWAPVKWVDGRLVVDLDRLRGE